MRFRFVYEFEFEFELGDWWMAKKRPKGMLWKSSLQQLCLRYDGKYFYFPVLTRKKVLLSFDFAGHFQSFSKKIPRLISQ